MSSETKQADGLDGAASLQPNSAADAGAPSKTRHCLRCGAPMRIYARFCRNCGARYTVTANGYCAACHAVVEAGADGTCSQCGGELLDVQVESQLIPAAAPTPTPAPVPAAAPAHGDSSLYCAKCMAENPPPADRCRRCGANLLPGRKLVDRLRALMPGLVAAAALGAAAYFLGRGELPLQLPAGLGPIVLAAGSLLCLFSGVLAALRRMPAWLKYENRAKRHIDLSPGQAVADLGRALQLAPRDRHTRLLRQRAKLYEKLGLAADASRDHLAAAMGSDASEDKPGSRRSGQLKALMASGQAKAVGYCPRCKAAVELDGKLRCQIHRRTKGRAVQYVIPSDLETGMQAVLRERAKEPTARRRRALGAVVALALVGVVWLLIARSTQIGERIPSTRLESLVAGRTLVAGPGAGGFGTVQQMRQMGINWYYEWGSCRGHSNCLPMTRAGCPWQPEYAVDHLMSTCGAQPCPGLMILNEPGLQDVCNATCQAEQLHDHAPQAHTINPNATVIFGNYAWPRSWQLDDLAQAWASLYPGLPLASFLHDNNVRIGVHHYAWAGYVSDAWRAALLAFRSDVKSRWNVDIVLTEYGALDSGPRWKQVIADQADWLSKEGIPAAPFYGGSVATWGCCPMTNAGSGLTEYGLWYAALNKQFRYRVYVPFFPWNY